MRYTLPGLAAAAAPTVAFVRPKASRQILAVAGRPLSHPLLWAAFALSAGIVWARFSVNVAYWTPPNWSVGGAILVLVLAAISARKSAPTASASALLAIALLGKSEFGLAGARPAAILPSELENRQVEITGFVTRASLPVLESAVSESEWHGSTNESYQQVDIRTESISAVDAASPAIIRLSLGVRIGIYEVESEANDSTPQPVRSLHEFQ